MIRCKYHKIEYILDDFKSGSLVGTYLARRLDGSGYKGYNNIYNYNVKHKSADLKLTGKPRHFEGVNLNIQLIQGASLTLVLMVGGLSSFYKN